MNRAGQMILGELALLAHVDQRELLAAIDSLLYFVDGRFAHARFGVVNNLQKAGRMLVCHKTSFSFVEEHRTKSGRTAHGMTDA